MAPAVENVSHSFCSVNKQIVPSLGSATANEDFFSSLSESSSVVNRGVTFASTSAAVCSRAGAVSVDDSAGAPSSTDRWP